ncbi:MAG: hypothetical protein QOG80_2278 [Pseudonocardiales bacterium]|jgi:hypothetical protein|nr:hypothetical protein [Pseudonocardiales bacterium]
MTTQGFLFARQKSPLRWPLALAAALAAVAHIPVIGSHLHEAPYMGVLFIVLTAACLALATGALTYDSPAIYAASAVTCSLAVVGYAVTRLIALPMLADDVGNWLEPLGIVSVAAELVVVALAVAALGHRSPHSSIAARS